MPRGKELADDAISAQLGTRDGRKGDVLGAAPAFRGFVYRSFAEMGFVAKTMVARTRSQPKNNPNRCHFEKVESCACTRPLIFNQNLQFRSSWEKKSKSSISMAKSRKCRRTRLIFFQKLYPRAPKTASFSFSIGFSRRGAAVSAGLDFFHGLFDFDEYLLIFACIALVSRLYRACIAPVSHRFVVSRTVLGLSGSIC